MEDVARRTIDARMIALDFIVIIDAYTIPSQDAVNGPMEKKGYPGYVKGRKAHKRKMKPFTIKRRKRTFFIFNRAIATNTTGKNRPQSNTGSLSETAMTIAYDTARRIFIRGSRRCIHESPEANSSPIIKQPFHNKGFYT